MTAGTQLITIIVCSPPDV